jgi:hypothetical protein
MFRLKPFAPFLFLNMGAAVTSETTVTNYTGAHLGIYQSPKERNLLPGDSDHLSETFNDILTLTRDCDLFLNCLQLKDGPGFNSYHPEGRGFNSR